MGGAALLVLAGVTMLLSATSRKEIVLHVPSLSENSLLIAAVALLVLLACAMMRGWLRRKSTVIRFLDAFRANLKQLIANPRLSGRAFLMSFQAEACVSGSF